MLRLFTSGDRRINERQAAVQRYWQGKAEVIGEKYIFVSKSSHTQIKLTYPYTGLDMP
jgi:hypothetical protein